MRITISNIQIRLKPGLLSLGLSLLILLCLNSRLPGQDEKVYAMIDSLQNIVDTSRGTEKVDAQFKLYSVAAELGHSAERPISYKLLEECLHLSMELNYGEGLYLCYSAYCNIYLNRGETEKALEYYKKALPYIDQVRAANRQKYLVGMYGRLSRIYVLMGALDSALVSFYKATEHFDKIEDCYAYSSAYVYLANLYILKGDIHEEIQARREAYNSLIDCETENKEAVLGMTASSLGYCLMKSGNFNEALKYFRLADSLLVSGVKISKRFQIYYSKQAANIARAFQLMGEMDSALYYRRLTLKRFNEFGFPETIIDVPNQYCYIGTIYREKGDFILAQEYFYKSLELRKSNHDSLGVGMCLDEMAEMARLEGRYYDAVSMLNEAIQWKSDLRDGKIDASRKAQEVESMSETYLYLGKVFADWKKYQDARMYYDTSYSLCDRVNLNRGKVLVDFFRGTAWQKQGNSDSALFYMKRAEKLADSLENRPLIAKVMAGMSLLQIEQGELALGMDYLRLARDIYESDGIKRELPAVYLELGKVSLLRGNYAGALSNLGKAYQESTKIGMITIKGEAAGLLAEVYERQGDFTKANFYLRQHITARDSVFTLETHRQLAELQALHESQRQQMEIGRLEQANDLNTLRYDRSRYVIISLGGVLVILLLFAILMIRQNSIRNQQRVLENQQKLFRSQMNPHFIFNSLTNIQHYIFSKDSYTAGKYLAIFARLMRNILNNSRLDKISLRTEIETIRQYLDLQKLRMEEKLEYTLEVADDLDKETMEVPPMLAQPFIENAIEHGLRNKEGVGHLTVSIRKNTNSLVYEIKDDGIGRKKAAEFMEKRHKDHQSMAVSLTRTRLQSLWGRTNIKVLEIIDLEDAEGNATGTRVVLRIPEY